MQFQSKRATVRSLIPRHTQIAFVVGLFLGIILGWMFSGVVSAVVQVGFIALVLIIFLAALLFWWSTRKAARGEGPRVYTWTSSSLPHMQDDQFRDANMPRDDQRPQDVIDLEELKEQLRREREP